ncbi:hypothetical protein LSPH24S_01433 [Lysinibacillus sphaericus]
MINNGYISKNAVEFIIKTEIPFLDIDLEEPYLLMQYKLDNPQLKYIYIHPSVKLPPINYQKQPRSTDYIITGNVFPETGMVKKDPKASLLDNLTHHPLT